MPSFNHDGNIMETQEASQCAYMIRPELVI